MTKTKLTERKMIKIETISTQAHVRQNKKSQEINLRAAGPTSEVSYAMNLRGEIPISHHTLLLQVVYRLKRTEYGRMFQIDLRA